MGCLRRRRRLQGVSPRRPRLGARASACHQSLVGGCQRLREMDLGKDRSAISAAERGGARIRNSSRHHDAVLVGRLNLNRTGQLRRGLQIWVWAEGSVPAKNGAGGFLRSKSLGTLSGSWQRLRVGGGLLEPELPRRPL